MIRHWSRFVAALAVSSILLQACDSGAASAPTARAPSAFDEAASANHGDGTNEAVLRGFVRVQLGRGVTVDLPQSFRVLSIAERDLIGAAAADQTGSSPESLGENLIRANSTPPSTYAAVSITSVVPPTVPYEDARTMTQRDVTPDVTAELQDNFTKMLGAVGQELEAFYGVRVERFGAYPALVQEYERSAPGGRSVVVQVNSIMTPDQEVRLTLSYRKSEAPLWRPVLAKIRSSLVIS